MRKSLEILMCLLNKNSLLLLGSFLHISLEEAQQMCKGRKKYVIGKIYIRLSNNISSHLCSDTMLRARLTDKLLITFLLLFLCLFCSHRP